MAQIPNQSSTPMFSDLIKSKKVLVCAGSGGVGKTTTAAALGLAAAKLGRRVCVVTIDPAKRLANALGISELSNAPTLIGEFSGGKLYAMMLDANATFNALIAQYAKDEVQAEKILANRLYRSLSSSLGGTQEYMAAEKLFELTQDERFDFVIVDTPPSRNALDFLDGPSRLSHFLENRLFRLLLMPTRTYLKAVGIATQALLRTISKVAGTELVADAVEFFQAFEGMEEGFRARARHVEALLADPSTAFILIAGPRRDSAQEATFFANRLLRSNIEVQGLIVNRVHPSFDKVKFDGNTATKIRALGASNPLGAMLENLESFEAISEREDHFLEDLRLKISSAPTVKIPLFVGDIHDLDGLWQVADYFL